MMHVSVNYERPSVDEAGSGPVEVGWFIDYADLDGSLLIAHPPSCCWPFDDVVG